MLMDAENVKVAMIGRFADFYSQWTELRPLGGELRGSCPLHGGTGQNFAVNPDTGLWNCFSSCQDGGDAFRFLEKLEGVSFPQALERLAAFAGVSGEAFSAPAPIRRVQSPPAADPVFLDVGLVEALHTRLMQSDAMRQWLSEYRGLTTETLVNYRLGMQKDEQGLYRITFPILDAEGRLLNIRRHLFAYKDGLDRTFKTLPWEKGLTAGLFPMRALAGQSSVLLVEGEGDALLACQMGFSAVTGTLGAGNWKDHWTEALRDCQRVTLLYDGDQPGRDGAQKAAVEILAAVADVRIASLPEGEDLTSWIVDQGATAADVQQVIDAATLFSPRKTKPPALASGEMPPPESWEIPVAFTSHDLPAFPLEALPDALAGFVSEVAASTQVPLDMPALIALSVVAAAGARRCIVQVGCTHFEPLNLYTAIVMPPGSRKSATLDALAAPLQEAEREMISSASEGIAVATETRGVEDKRLSYLREQAAKAKDQSERESLLHELGEQAMTLTEVPVLPRLLVDDCTPEKLASLMADQGGTLAMFSAEAGIFGTLAGRYSDGKANLDLFLKAHSGESYRVDRQGRPSVSIPRACLTMCLTAQPDVLTSLADTPAFRGRGLLGRFLYSLPQNLVGTRLYQNRPVDAAARRRYEATIHALLALPEASLEDTSLRHVLRLEGEALNLWAEFANETERRQAEGGDMAGIADFGSKLAGAAARLAGGMHLVENAHQGCPWAMPISTETVAAAWAIAEYLSFHALAAFGQMGADPNVTMARRILKWIERTGTTEFSLRECHQYHRNVSAPSDLLPALNLLCERSYLRLKPEVPGGRTGGRPRGTIYEVNPLHKTHKSHKT